MTSSETGKKAISLADVKCHSVPQRPLSSGADGVTLTKRGRSKIAYSLDAVSIASRSKLYSAAKQIQSLVSALPPGSWLSLRLSKLPDRNIEIVFEIGMNDVNYSSSAAPLELLKSSFLSMMAAEKTGLKLAERENDTPKRFSICAYWLIPRKTVVPIGSEARSIVRLSSSRHSLATLPRNEGKEQPASLSIHELFLGPECFSIEWKFSPRALAPDERSDLKGLAQRIAAAPFTIAGGRRINQATVLDETDAQYLV